MRRGDALGRDARLRARFGDGVPDVTQRAVVALALVIGVPTSPIAMRSAGPIDEERPRPR